MNFKKTKEISPFEDIYDRIATLVGNHNQKDVAFILGIKQSSVSAAKKKASIPSDWYITLYEKYGVNIDWLRSGTQPMFIGDLSKPRSPSVGEDPNAKFHNISTSVYFTNSIIKKKSIVYEKKEDILLPVQLHKKADLVFFYEAKGMEPFLRQEAFVGVSTKNTNLISGEIYAVHLPIEGVVFRRLIIMEDEILLCFEQQNMPPISMSEEKLKSSLIGRAIWTIQDV